MAARPTRLVIVIRPAPGRHRLAELRAWLRALAPTALLLVAPASLPDLPDAEVVQLDATDGLDGPLAVATELTRLLGR